MKNVRLTYKKDGVMRFCSHLDVTRYMTRLMRKASVPLWHTEGFNPRPYITFALPLPLGLKSEYEIMDIRIIDDNYDIDSLPQILNRYCFEGIVFISAAEPILKTGNLCFADYQVVFDDKGALCTKLETFLNQQTIIVLKRTKRGNEKEIDIKEHLKNTNISQSEDSNTVFCFTLPAGGSLNISPDLLLSAFNEKGDTPYTTTRLLLKDMEENAFK